MSMVDNASDSTELWIQARKQLSEYELRTSELQLDLQQALRGIQSARDSLTRTKKEASAVRASKMQQDAVELQEIKAIQALLSTRETEKQDTQRLVQQLGMVRQKLMAAESEVEAERKQYEAHIKEQLEHNKRLEALLEAIPNEM